MKKIMLKKMKRKSKSIWCFLDSKKHCDVVQWALAANVTVAEMVIIASKAAQLATSVTGDSERSYYREYLDQLLNGDYQCLRQWLGWMIEAGSRKAVEAMKLLIRARLQSRRRRSDHCKTV